MNILGKPIKSKKCDIPISGIGVATDHNKISFDSKSGQMFIHPNVHPKKNKTFVNGKLLKEDMALNNGDRVLFGNHNFYVVNFPGSGLP